MARLRALPLLLSAAALVAGCGHNDNQIYIGSLSSNVQSSFGDVNSALNGVALATDQSGRTDQRNVILMSDLPDLCGKLTADPNFLRAPGDALQLLVLESPPHQVGTFYVGQYQTDTALLVAAGSGSAPVRYPGVSCFGGGAQFCSIAIGALASGLGGSAQGNFVVTVVDSTNQGYLINGQFNTQQCPALAGAYVPRFTD